MIFQKGEGLRCRTVICGLLRLSSLALVALSAGAIRLARHHGAGVILLRQIVNLQICFSHEVGG
jgi:hypothetical protein